MNKTYPVINQGSNSSDPFPIYLGRITPFPLEVLPVPLDNSEMQPIDNLSSEILWRIYLRTACDGYSGGELMNISRIHVACALFLGPPLRTDGGENNVYDPGSTWVQSLHTCASMTRASIQTFTFSIGSFSDSSTANLNATRHFDRPTVLWAMEKRNEIILESIPLWGRIDEQYFGGDLSSFWTLQSDQFLLPATSASVTSRQLPEGSPQNAHSTIWLWVNAPMIVDATPSLTDYTGSTDFGVKTKFQNLVLENGPTIGAETILKLMWTDMLSNQLVGTTNNDTLSVSLNLHSLNYDFRFAIPGYMLVLIWLPVFLTAIFLLASGKLKWIYLKDVYNHLSIGRVVTNSSALRVKPTLASDPSPSDKRSEGYTRENRDWAKNFGLTQVQMVLGHKGQQSETMRLMPTQSYPDDH
jgi:hypothetical protein